MRSQCFCGAAYVGWRHRAWFYWLDNHNCPGAPVVPEKPEPESDHRVDAGTAQSERSYQDDGFYDGYSYRPGVNARAAGFAID